MHLVVSEPTQGLSMYFLKWGSLSRKPLGEHSWVNSANAEMINLLYSRLYTSINITLHPRLCRDALYCVWHNVTQACAGGLKNHPEPNRIQGQNKHGIVIVQK